jgi:hypothetical protein
LESQIVAFVRQGNFERISATATAAEVGRFDERLTIDEDLKGRDIGRVTMLYSLKIATKRSVGFSFVDIPPNTCNTVRELDGPPEASILGFIKKGINSIRRPAKGYRNPENFKRAIFFNFG